MAKASSDPNEMSFLDHLEELRWHLIRSTIAIVLIGLVAFVMKDFIFDTVIFGPKKPDFPTYRVFCKLAKLLGFRKRFVPMNLFLPFRADKWQSSFLPIYGLQSGLGL